MDEATARWLVSAEAAPYRERARTLADPSALGTAAAWRRDLEPDRAAAVLTLEALRRRGTAKLGDLAAGLWWTPDGLEQATRWSVATWRARALVRLGVTGVVDLGCGLGVDALAAQRAGLAVVAFERDPVTAILAAANLGLVEVRCADAETADLAPWSADPHTALFLDPGRRTARGRSWRVEDLSPSWAYVQSLLSRAPVVVKLAPGFPYDRLPAGADVTWVSDGGDLVETTVWAAPGATGRRQAVVLTGGGEERLDAGAVPPTGELGRYVYEPDPAVIRARAVGTLAGHLGARGVAPSIPYLTGDALVETPFATAYEVDEVLDWSPRVLRAWARDHGIGTLEIKTRGLGVDPARLRPGLHLAGRTAATVILTPTIRGARALVVRRTAPPDPSPPGVSTAGAKQD